VAIVGDKPDHGIRVRLERTARGYDGTATTKDARWSISIVIDDDGEVDVTGDAPDDVRERVRLIVRVEARNAKASGANLPRSIQRWRAT
jgi:hypothetical protein